MNRQSAPAASKCLPGLFASVAAFLAAPASLAADPFEMQWRELARGVWVGVRPLSYRAPVVTNTTVVIGSHGVLVFDAAGLAIQGERLVEKITEITDKPITHIAISHWHGDHSMGDHAVLERFPAAEVISHEFTSCYIASPNMDKVEPRDVEAENAYRAKVEKALATGVRSDGTPVTRPTRTMSDRLVIDLGGISAELRHNAPGNTKGDMFLWLPEQRILAAGDIVVRPTPYGFFSHPQSWAGVLRELKSFEAKYIVPGHGDPGGRTGEGRQDAR
jgi:cyclase